MSYNKMEETVQKLCYSLLHDPERWRINVHTLEDLSSGVRYWIEHGSITMTFNGHSQSTVFSHEQGVRVRLAFEKLCVIKATRAQEHVIQAMAPPSPQPKQSFWSRLLSFFLFGPI